MSGIAHYLEDEGIATVIIALVREHAEAVRPPRALWVPYMLWRPFGEPNNPDLQTTIIRQAFALLDADPELASEENARLAAELARRFADKIALGRVG